MKLPGCYSQVKGKTKDNDEILTIKLNQKELAAI